jgi:hypothetical protein
MFKIKLLTLLLTSIFLLSCTKQGENLSYNQYSIGSIGGEYDGLILKNLLSTHLRSFNLHSNQSDYEIRSGISHSNSIFITNIDNTSDRERVTSNITIDIFNKLDNCVTDRYEEEVEQFFIYASSDKFMSNQKALEKIKFDNTEALVKKFINNIGLLKHTCDVE